MSVTDAAADFRRLLEADRLGRLGADDLVRPTHVVTIEKVVTIAGGAGAAASAAAVGASPLSPSVPATAERSATAATAGAAPDVPYETVPEEIERLNTTIVDLTETNDKIMAQNIALLSDLEAAQRAVRDLRSEKDALAVQLRRLLAVTSAGGASGER